MKTRRKMKNNKLPNVISLNRENREGKDEVMELNSSIDSNTDESQAHVSASESFGNFNKRNSDRPFSKNSISAFREIDVTEKDDLYVIGFSTTISQKDLKQYFSKFGKVKRIRLVPKKPPFAFVGFQTWDECSKVLKCRLHKLLGDTLIVKQNHMSNKVTDYPKDLEITYSTGLHKALVECNRIEDQFNCICDKLQPTQAMYSHALKCRDHIEEVLEEYFPNIRVDLFGSYANDCAFRSSDYDIYLNLEGFLREGQIPEWMYSLGNLPETNQCDVATLLQSGELPIESFMRLQKIEQLQHIHRMLKRAIKGIHPSFVIKSKSPIIRLQYEGVLCDISIGSGIVLFNSKLVSFYMNHDIRVRWLILSVVFWAKINKLIGASELSNYAVANLCLFYLMLCDPPILPSVAYLRAPCGEPIRPLIVGGFNCSFSVEMIPRSESNECIEDVLKGFFSFYANFQFDAYVVNIFGGAPMKKEMVASLHPNFQHESPLCIQDPFELDRNIASRCTDKFFSKFIQLITKASNEMNHKREPHNWGLTQLFYSSFELANHSTPPPPKNQKKKALAKKSTPAPPKINLNALPNEESKDLTPNKDSNVSQQKVNPKPFLLKSCFRLGPEIKCIKTETCSLIVKGMREIFGFECTILEDHVPTLPLPLSEPSSLLQKVTCKAFNQTWSNKGRNKFLNKDNQDKSFLESQAEIAKKIVNGLM